MSRAPRTLVLAEQGAGQVWPSTYALVAAAAQLGAPVDLLVVGSKLEGVAEAAVAIAGVSQVIVVDDPVFEHPVAETLADLLVSVAGDYDAIVGAASSVGKSVMPRVAALLNVMQVSEVVAVRSPTVFDRLIYAGNAVATVESNEAVRVLTIQVTQFAPASGGPPAPIVARGFTPGERRAARFVGRQAVVSERPDLGSARVVVSGGRGLKSKEQFEAVLFPLADALSAAIGASRAAVDAGFVGNDHQVGQTGRIVAPELYVACGISGAIQHLAGMKDSRVIVAINSDAGAPIFEIADYGLVADVFEAVPELTRKLAG